MVRWRCCRLELGFSPDSGSALVLSPLTTVPEPFTPFMSAVLLRLLLSTNDSLNNLRKREESAGRGSCTAEGLRQLETGLTCQGVCFSCFYSQLFTSCQFYPLRSALSTPWLLTSPSVLSSMAIQQTQGLYLEGSDASSWVRCPSVGCHLRAQEAGDPCLLSPLIASGCSVHRAQDPSHLSISAK